MTAPTLDSRAASSITTAVYASFPSTTDLLAACHGRVAQRLAQPRSSVVGDYTLVAATPAGGPGLWSQFVDGAWGSYSRHGVSSVLDLDEVASGATTTMFYVVLDSDGSMLGGVRAQGPYTMVEQSHVLTEWKHSPGLTVVTDRLRDRIGEGIVEMKSAWVDADGAGRTVSTVLARTALPTLDITGSRFLFASAADHVLRLWEISGGRIDDEVPAAAYPSEQYRTQLMWWDAETIAEHAEPAVWTDMARHTRALADTPVDISAAA